MQPWIVLDFETRSRCELVSKPKRPGAGADRYAEDETTEVICLAWQIYGGREDVWYPGYSIPTDIAKAIMLGYIFVAHNARFERAIWQRIMVGRYGWPVIPLEKWADTMARAMQLQLPGRLEKVAQWLDLPTQKDMDGHRLTLGLSRADKDGNLPDVTPAIRGRVGEYCLIDVRTQTALQHRVGFLPASERAVWEMDQRINDRGILMDMPLVRAMRDIVSQATVPLLERFRTLTGTDVTKIAQTKIWLAGRGVPMAALDKEAVAALIGDIDGTDEDFEPPEIPLPDDVHEALSIRQLVGSASVGKLKAIEACVCADGRARGALQYHAAGPGRWGGRLFQPQNFPRGLLRVETQRNGELVERPPDPETLVATLLTGDASWVEMMYGPAVQVCVSALRHTIIAQRGYALTASDFAGIEARFCLALAGAWDKVALMASGADLYCDMASQVYGRAITKADVEERQIGKNSVLGLGFGMGAPKFRFKYAPKQSLDFVQGVVDTYRKEWAPEVPEMWDKLGSAALWTIVDGRPHDACGVEYRLEDQWLRCRLPSGRDISYFKPAVIDELMPWSTDERPVIRTGWTYQAEKQGQRKTLKGFGGLLTENICQALARDLLVVAMFKCEDAGLPIAFTVHDEIVLEHNRPDGQKMLEQIMEDRPSWARTINVPVTVEAWTGDRYRK